MLSSTPIKTILYDLDSKKHIGAIPEDLNGVLDNLW
jgi:hypothetical protein